MKARWFGFMMTLAGVLLAGAAQAGISLDLPSAGNYTNSTTVSTAVVDASGATFDIVYTVTADDLHGSTPTDWLQVSVNSMGVNDGTIYGTYNEWMSFTSLSIENFNAGGSGLAADDIAELTFSAITLTSVGHSNDGMDLFFSGDKSGTANNVNLSGYVANTIQTIDISGFGSGTALSIEADTYQDTNKFGVGGLEVSYAVIPEPAALGMIMVSGAGMLFVRRWFML